MEKHRVDIEIPEGFHYLTLANLSAPEADRVVTLHGQLNDMEVCKEKMLWMVSTRAKEYSSYRQHREPLRSPSRYESRSPKGRKRSRSRSLSRSRESHKSRSPPREYKGHHYPTSINRDVSSFATKPIQYQERIYSYVQPAKMSTLRTVKFVSYVQIDVPHIHAYTSSMYPDVAKNK